MTPGRLVDVGMRSVPRQWRVFRMPSVVLYSLLSAAALSGVCLGLILALLLG